MSRALVVDDHVMIRRGVRQLLADELPDLEVVEAASAEAAEALLAAQTFDLALVDVNLPGRSGLALVQAVRSLRPGLPVLVLSVHPESELALRCLRLGAAGYLCKDGAAETLVEAVRTVLAGGRHVTPDLAGRLAERHGEPDPQAPAASPLECLSERELQVLRLVSRGFSLKAIAQRLGISEKTVASYRARLSEKLGVSTNVELTRLALLNRLVD